MAAPRTAETTKSTKEGYRALIGKPVGARGTSAGESRGQEPVPPGATVLACIDGSEWSIRALFHRFQQPLDRVLLLYISPQGSPGYVECGWMVLEAAMHRCRLQEGHPPIECRLEVGDAASRILAVCREERPDIVVIPVRDRSGLPSSAGIEELALSLWSACECRVLLASPRKMELWAGDRRWLDMPRAPLTAG